MNLSLLKRFLCVAMIFCFCMTTPSMGKEPRKNYQVGLAPVQVISTLDRSFLSQGVESIISSRISVKDRIVVIDRGATLIAFEKTGRAFTKENLQKMGQALHTDYLIWGTLKEEKEIFQVQFRMLNIKNGKEAFDLQKNEVTLDQMIPLASWISEKVKEKILNETAPPGQMAMTNKGGDAERHAHPDSLIPAIHGR